MGEAIGIDLGTTNSGAGYFKDGEARILLTTQLEAVTPSVISYNPNKDRMSTGRQAWKLLEKYPDTTIFSIKRLMGRTFDDEDHDRIQKIQEQFGYRIVEADDPQDRGLYVQIGQEKFSPVDISAMILSRVKEDASRALDNRPVTHAVITVPAYFNERQKAATRLAAEKAGLIVKKVIDEPTAAAVAFGIDHKGEQHRLLVYDMGGGTFDVSLIMTTQQQFAVMGVEGNNWLGGDDFDLQIVKYMLDWVRENKGLDLAQDKKFQTAAKRRAEEVKIALSGQEEVEIEADLKTETGGEISIDLVVTRSQFEGWIQSQVDTSMNLARKLLASQDLTVDDITAVLMVGGSTAVPLVYETAYNVFGRDKVRRDIDPMQCVALGAGMLAARLQSIECPQCSYENAASVTVCEQCQHNLEQVTASGDISLGEVTPQSLGLEVVWGRTAGMFSPIIEKGAAYPVSIKKPYYTTSDRRIRLPIYQGEAKRVDDNELQAVVEFDLPETVPPETLVEVMFGLDRDQVLRVSIEVKGYPHLTFGEVVKRARPRPVEEPSELEVGEDEDWRRKLQSAIATANRFIDKYGSYLATGTRIKLESDIERGRQAMADGDKTEGKRIAEAITETIFGSGAATQLYLVERIVDQVGKSEADQLIKGAQALKKAHDDDNAEREERAAAMLEVQVSKAIAQRLKQIELQKNVTGFEGLLLERFRRG